MRSLWVRYLTCCLAPLPLATLTSRVVADTPTTPEVSPTTRPTSAFDPARHMHVSEVKPGMIGYGLSVFAGDKVERFNVEVISILRNFNAQHDVVLIRCHDAALEHTGSIQGMSGSPIFLKDETGRERMIGAFAYGWPLSKDPLAGVQPIEYMLDLPVALPGASGQASGESARGAAHEAAEQSRTPWTAKQAGLLPSLRRREETSIRYSSSRLDSEPSHLLGDADRTPRLQPLSTPLMASGIQASVLDQLGPLFRENGLVPLQAGGGSATAGLAPVKLEPGSVLAVPLLIGDLDLTAVGTCTEVIGDRVWGFGHPFNNEGRVSLPMASGRVNGIIPSLQMSFKLGATDAIRGTLTTDASVGVVGSQGISPPMIPVELSVSPADGSPPRVYHFQAARHARLTPMITGAAFAGALSGSSELPQFNTIDYDLTIAFANGQAVRLANRAVNGKPTDIFGDALSIMQNAADNPFERVLVSKITGTAKVSTEVRQAQIQDVHLPKSRFKPGETVKAFVTYEPFRSVTGTIPVELELPRDLLAGSYQLVISDAERYFADEQESEPFRLSARNIEEVFMMLKDVATIRQNALYIRLVRQPDGVAIGRTAMPRLPSSRRQVMLGAGRSDTTAYISSTVKIIPTDLVMSGSADFTIRVEAGSKVAVSGSNPPGRATPGAPSTPGKADERKTPAPKTPTAGSASPPAPED